MDRERLAGRVALVTGASYGIGAAAAQRLGAEGAAVAVAHHVDPVLAAQAEGVAEQIRAGGGRAFAVGADLNQPDDITAMVQAVRDEFGAGPDLLIANAAAHGRQPWQEISIEKWDLVMSVNVRSLWLLTKAAYPDL